MKKKKKKEDIKMILIEVFKNDKYVMFAHIEVAYCFWEQMCQQILYYI